ncbi:MAG: FixH family protein [Planctomycetota bacterium]|nr:FixH family protein [Planctomycetota bacterium]
MRRGAVALVLIGVITLLSLAGAGALIYYAHSDGGFAVEPDYYAQALKWDEKSRQRERSAQLGWRARIASAPSGSRVGAVRLELRLVDSAESAVTGALVTAEVFANARASERSELRFAEVESGVYVADFVPGGPGSWHVRLRAERGTELFLDERDVLLGGPAD